MENNQFEPQIQQQQQPMSPMQSDVMQNINQNAAKTPRPKVHNGWWNILMYFGVYQIGAQIIIGAVVGFMMASAGSLDIDLSSPAIINTMWVCEGIVFLLTLFTSRYLLKEDLPKCKPIGKMLLYGVGVSLGLLGINILSSMVIEIFVDTSNNINQEAVNDIITSHPIYAIFMTLIFAPIVEELVFRGGIYQVVQRKIGDIWAIVISAFMFGGVHVLASLLAQNWSGLIFIIVYVLIGAVISFAYYKTKNIYFCIFIHFVNNFVAIVPSFFME